jgi:hypothetical protein
MKISEILLKYKSDKNLGLGPTGEGHCYGPAYDQIFDSFNRNDKLNILEIGVQKGGSLVAWKEYFQNASIYGIDIEDQILDEYRRNDFNYLIEDIKSDEAKAWLKDKTFDIIIDDGSHKPYDIMYVVDNFLKNLNPKGWMVLEDCWQPEQWISLVQNLIPADYTMFTYDVRSIKNNIDDFLIIIQKN